MRNDYLLAALICLSVAGIALGFLVTEVVR